MLLQLRQTVDHQGVFEVGCDHAFKQVHVVRAKLAKALVHQATQFTVAFTAVINYTLDVGIALIQVLDHFIKVARQQFLV